jgi:hypothetical protein
MLRTIIFRAAVIPSLLVVMCATQLLAGTTGVLSGHVYNFMSRVPAAGAIVTISSASNSSDSTVADAKGFYTFVSVNPGYYWIRAVDPQTKIDSECSPLVTIDADAISFVDLETVPEAIFKCSIPEPIQPSLTASLYSFDVNGDFEH